LIKSNSLYFNVNIKIIILY